MAAGFVARLQIGRRWRNLAVIALLVAIVGGIATSLIAGSRRSTSVVHRYFEAMIPYDLTVGSSGALPRQQILNIPGVVRADPDSYIATTLVRADGTLGAAVNGIVYSRKSLDRTFRVLDGAIADAADATALMVNESFAKEFGLHAGDRLTLRTYATSDADDVYSNKYGHPHGPQFEFRIAAVIRSPADVALDEQHAGGGTSYGTSAGIFVPDRFYEANRKRFLTFGDAYDVQLAGTTTRAFEAAAKRATSGSDSRLFIGPPRFAERSASFDTPVGLESTALLGLGIAAALAGAIVVAMLLRAEQRAYEHDAELLRALGATRGQLGAAAALRTAPFALAGALGALGVAFALSGRFPIGVGRMLELDPGLDANLVVFAVSAFVAFALVSALSVAFERFSRSRRSPRHTVRAGVDRLLARNGAPPELVVGSHLAFDRGTSARGAPTRPAIAGGAVALALVVALGVLVGGIDHLRATPSAHGWPWDAVIGNVNFAMPKARETRLVHDRRVRAATRARYGQATVGGISTEVLAYDPHGSAPPEMLSGRLPRADDEIAPGAKLLRELHAKVGGRLRLSLAGGEFELENDRAVDRELTVVGEALPPVMGESEFGEVAVISLPALGAAGGVTGPQLVLARLRGSDPQATTRGLARDYTPDILLDNVPSRMVNLHRVRTLPILGALLAATLGTMLLAYTLAVAVRTRIRNLGILRALGMTSRRVGRVLVWQGIVLALAISVIGFPIGLVLGSITWRLVAHSLGVAGHPIVPVTTALLAPASIAVGIGASLLPARRARRADVSRLLRAE